jgi:hypothetical protein
MVRSLFFFDEFVFDGSARASADWLKPLRRSWMLSEVPGSRTADEVCTGASKSISHELWGSATCETITLVHKAAEMEKEKCRTYLEECAKPARTVMETLGQTWKCSKRAAAVARAKRHWENSMKNDEQA